MKRRKRLVVRQSHTFPYAYQIGYWQGRSGHPDQDFRLASLQDFQNPESAQTELKSILKTHPQYC